MKFSFSKWLETKDQAPPALLALHSGFLQVAQVMKKDSVIDVIGRNHADLPPGLVKKGEITDCGAFGAIFTRACAEARPNPIKSGRLLVAAGYEVVYPFLLDFPHHVSDAILKDAINDHILKTSPIPPDEMDLEYLKTVSGEVLSFGAVGVPKKWMERLLKCVAGAGIEEAGFITQPYAEILSGGKPDKENYALFSLHENRVFASIFHNHRIYDAYVINSDFDPKKINCESCLEEFEEAGKHFQREFKKTINKLYFAGFPKNFKKRLSDFFAQKKYTIEFLDPSASELYGYFKDYPGCETILGLTNYYLNQTNLKI
jgi:hypothetical protein